MKMLVCTDGSEQSQKAVQEAVRIADNFKSVEVTVLYVYEAVATPAYSRGRGDIPEEVLLRYEGLSEKAGQEILESAAAEFKAKGINCEILIKKGYPSDVIIEEAAEGGYDMAVMGSRGLGGLRRLLLGSVSNAVAQQAKTNVLIIK